MSSLVRSFNCGMCVVDGEKVSSLLSREVCIGVSANVCDKLMIDLFVRGSTSSCISSLNV